MKHATFGHVDNGLRALRCVVAGKGDLFNVFDELARPAFVENFNLAVRDLDFKAAGRKRSGKNDRARILRDINEAAAAVQAAAEPRGIDVALLVALGHAEASEIEAAAVIEVEHLVLVENGMGVCR